jgi:hypothetical protein
LSPSATTRTLAAASIVGFGLLLPLFLFWALAIVMSAARAMRWAALGMVATILLPYSKQTWDVFPCAVFVAGIAWLTMRRFSARHPSYGTSVAMFLMAGAASWFRFSLAPFVLLGCCLVELLATRRADAERVAREAWMRVGLGVVAFLALLLPVFAHNALVTGNPVRPPTARFELNQLWVHFPLGGAVGLLASPNRGLVWFSPIFVVAVALTWTWRSLPDTLHSYVLAWGLPLGSYILAVGSVQNWGAFGWGPRYLVPTLPLVWVPVAVVGARAMTGSSAMRLATITLLGLSIALAGLATLTNWDAVAATGSDVVAKSTAYPKQIIETARYVGRRIPVEDDSPADSGIDTTRWPDLAVLYTTRKAGLPDPAGYAAFLALVASASWLFVAADRRLRASDLEHRGAPAIRWRR